MMSVQHDGDDALTQWVREQFTPQRCVRRLDGGDPVARRGGVSLSAPLQGRTDKL